MTVPYMASMCCKPNVAAAVSFGMSHATENLVELKAVVGTGGTSTGNGVLRSVDYFPTSRSK